MSFDHENLDVYSAALDFLVACHELVERLPDDRSYLGDQLTHASTSIVLDIAEGSGGVSDRERRRCYLCATRTATECAALLDVCRRLDLIRDAETDAAKQRLARIVARLAKLSKRLDMDR